MKRRLIAILLIATLIIPCTAYAAERHGRDRSRRVNTPDNTVPAGYDVNPETQGKAKDKGYDRFFLKNDLQEVRVEISGDNLDYVLQHASEEAMALAKSVTIGGVKVENVGFRTKGAYTKNETNNSSSDRFSFTVNFGKYVKKSEGYSATQNFFGVKKISFNNFFFDKTMLKEYSVYKLFNEMGVPSSQYGLAKLYINDEYFGVYFMVEGLQESILESHYNTSKVSKFIMKPQGSSPRFNDGDFADCMGNEGLITLDSLIEKGYITQNADGTYSAKSTLSNYSFLWEKDSDNFNDCIEVIPAMLTWLYRLTQLSNGKDFSGNKIDVNSDKYLELLERVIDVDESTRYFATHSFVLQMDNMFTWRQNYGLYVDENAKSKMIPWDYDHSWGYENPPADGEASANWSIDKMYNAVTQQAGNYYSDDYDLFYAGEAPYNRNNGYPLFNVIYQNKSLRDKYHEYISDCAKIGALGGRTSFGKVFMSRRIGNSIDRLYDKVVAAASEPLANNVYYLQYSQPDDVKRGSQGLKQMVALRSVGAWLQAHGIDAHVTGYGYLTGCLGDDSTNATYSTGGENIAVVDDNTGIFTIANYNGKKQESTSSGSTDPWSGWDPWGGGGGNPWGGWGMPTATPTAPPQATPESGDDSNIGPELSGTILDDESAEKQSIQTLVDAKADGKNNIVVYKMENTKAAISKYKIYIPVPSEESEIYLYNKDDNSLTKLTKENVYDGHMAVVSVDDFSYLVVADEEGKTAIETGTETDPTFDEPVPTMPPSDGAPEDPESSYPPSDGSPEDPDNISNPDNPGSTISHQSGTTKQDGNQAQTPGTVNRGTSQSGTIKPVAVSIKKLKKVKAGSIKVSWKKASANSGYQIRYAYKKNFKKAKKETIYGGNWKSTLIKVSKKKKICYVRIRSFVDGENKTYYSKWSAIKKIKLKK